MATTALESAKGSTETDNKNAQSSTSTAGTASKPKSTDQAGDLEGLESWSEEDEIPLEVDQRESPVIKQ